MKYLKKYWSYKETIALLFFLFFLNQKLISQPNIISGDRSFKSGNYKEALKSYQSEYNNNPTNAYINYQIGLCYLNMNTYQIKALKYLNFALNTDDYKSDPSAIFHLAEAYFYSYKFNKAIEIYSRCSKIKENNQKIEQSKKRIQTCQNAIHLMQNERDEDFINLGTNINSKNSEIFPFIDTEEKILFFNKKYKDNLDVYFSRKRRTSNKWKKAIRLSNTINSNKDDYIAGISNDGKFLIIFSKLNNNFDIKYSKHNNYNYDYFIDPGVPVNSQYNEQGAFLNNTGDTMFFASDRPEGYGGFDLYYSIKLPNNQWGIPINLGKNINTEFDENYPRLSIDGKTLYFCSKGRNSMGGYDIFKANLNNKGKWGAVENLSYPINTVLDNYNINILENPRYAYISSFNSNTYGESDIYKIVFNKKEADYLVLKGMIYIFDPNKSEIIPYSDKNDNIEIIAYHKKTKEIFGKYKANSKSSYYIISLPPGEFILEFKGKNYSVYKKIINIDESLIRTKLQTLNVIMQ